MISALVTEALGFHLLFGAFLAGAVMPKQREFVAYVVGKFESLTVCCCSLCFSRTPDCEPTSDR